MKAKQAQNKRFPYHIFFIYFGILLLMSGIHTGFITLGNQRGCSPIIQTALPIIYWALIAAALTAYTRGTIKRNYDKPMQNISDAAEKVAKGDFSVRLPVFSRLGSVDYLDRMTADFNKMVEELAGVETLRTDFIANVSHELKTPLAVMQNYGTMLQQPGLSEGKRIEYAKAVTEASRRLADMVSNILKLNKLENQSLYPDAKTYDLGEQLCTCLLGFEEIWERKGLDIQTDIQEDVRVTADPELLSLVWNNLFSNAVKFTEAGGMVSLTLEVQEEMAVVTVSDTGCGIPSEVGRHIFEKFYQGDTSHATQGNGLGLALVKRVIDIMDGEILVNSEAGKGSAFTVRLRREMDGTV